MGAVPNTVQVYNLAQAGDFPAALALYERVLREDPGHIGARTGRIRVLAYQKEYDKARHLAQVLVHEYPEQSEAHALYGWVIEREPDIPTETLQACVEAFGPLAQSPEHRVLILEIRSRLPDPISSEQKNTLRE